MVAWSAVDRTHAVRLAAALGRGDDTALDSIYDAFGAGLYDYCQMLLGDRERAADVLHGVLVATPAQVGRLRAPDRLRTWLYALVRAQCLYVRMTRDRPDPADEPEFTGAQQVAISALAGLDEAQREALHLTIRHNLTAGDLADVLGMPHRQAADLARQARRRLDATLLAAQTARDRRDHCPVLAVMADGWPLTAATCDKVVRHVEDCRNCSGHQPVEISINRLLWVLPAAAVPDDLRERVLTTATAPECEDQRAALAERAGPFNDAGWPQPPQRHAPQQAATRPVRTMTIGATMVGVFVVAIVVLLLTVGSVLRSPSASVGDGWPADSGLPSGATRADALAPPVSPSRSTTAPAGPRATPSVRTPTAAPSRSQPRSTRPTARPAPAAPRRSIPIRSGRLRTHGCFMYSGRRSCPIMITAEGGPVTWSVRGTSRPELRAYGGGTLNEGQSTWVTVYYSGYYCRGGGSGTIAFSPSGTASVRWSC